MQIEKLTVENFKKIKSQTYDLGQFDLLVGGNNSGKSSILQAIAIWQYCIDEFRRSPHKARQNWVQCVLPNFSVLPIPHFNLLWNERNHSELTPRHQRQRRDQIHIKITLYWLYDNGEKGNLGLEIQFQANQSILARPIGDWQNFRIIENKGFPRIVYVPPFSGLEPTESFYDDGKMQLFVGKAQPGSVLRNLLLRAQEHSAENWNNIVKVIQDWFHVDLLTPEYERGKSIDIIVNYKIENILYDIIAGGSGFHQILTLLAFLYGYQKVDAILLDEPDAHLHVNLQRQILDFFRRQANTQFFIASHAEEFIKRVESNMILSLLSSEPKRLTVDKRNLIDALSNVENMTIVETARSPYILYVEGEDDQRILAGWAEVLGKKDILDKFHFEIMGGGDKKTMETNAEEHIKAIRQFNPSVKYLTLFDYDDESSYHPHKQNANTYEWKRRNIDNYLLVPDVWKRIAEKELISETEKVCQLIDVFFNGQNLSLPTNSNWKTVKANIFEIINGKKILFEQEDSLFYQIEGQFGKKINRSTLALSMKMEELHEDIVTFFEKLEEIINK